MKIAQALLARSGGPGTFPSLKDFDAASETAYHAGKAAGKAEFDALRTELEALSPEQRKRRLEDLKCEYRELEQEDARLRRDLERLRGILGAHDDLSEMARQMRLEPATSSSVHRLRQSLKDGFFLNRKEKVSEPLDTEGIKAYEEFFRTAHSFVIQHDWAAAFKNAGDYDDATFRLPFETCVFEFKVSGHAVAVLATEADELVYLQAVAETRSGWFSFEKPVLFQDELRTEYSTGEPDPIASALTFLRPQIKAISVALDAKVAEIEVVRAPHKLNEARARRNKPPVMDYHVVSLAARHRAKAAPTSGHTDRRVRLHFRRGHWRHFESFKTWIRWTLVGDPALGFVDKEYRL